MLLGLEPVNHQFLLWRASLSGYIPALACARVTLCIVDDRRIEANRTTVISNAIHRRLSIFVITMNYSSPRSGYRWPRCRVFGRHDRIGLELALSLIEWKAPVDKPVMIAVSVIS